MVLIIENNELTFLFTIETSDVAASACWQPNLKPSQAVSGNRLNLGLSLKTA